MRSLRENAILRAQGAHSQIDHHARLLGEQVLDAFGYRGVHLARGWPNHRQQTPGLYAHACRWLAQAPWPPASTPGREIEMPVASFGSPISLLHPGDNCSRLATTPAGGLQRGAAALQRGGAAPGYCARLPLEF